MMEENSLYERHKELFKENMEDDSYSRTSGKLMMQSYGVIHQIISEYLAVEDDLTARELKVVAGLFDAHDCLFDFIVRTIDKGLER